MLTTLLVLLQIAVFGVANPVLTPQAKGEEFLVQFEPGATFVKVVFQQQVVTEVTEQWPDGKYTPYKSFNIDTTETHIMVNWDYIRQYNVEWKVWAEVSYTTDERIHTVKSNVVEVVR